MGAETFNNAMASFEQGVQRTRMLFITGQERAAVVGIVENEPTKIVSSQTEEKICR